LVPPDANQAARAANAVPLDICYWRVRYFRVTLTRKRMSRWVERIAQSTPILIIGCAGQGPVLVTN